MAPFLLGRCTKFHLIRCYNTKYRKRHLFRYATLSSVNATLNLCHFMEKQIIMTKKGGETMEFGEKIKYLREKERMSQEELAEKIGVSRQAVTKWENGGGIPDLNNIKKLVAIFNISYDDFFKTAKLPDTRSENLILNQFLIKKGIQKVYRGLLEILSTYEISVGYNVVPFTDNEEMAWTYFDRKLCEVRADASTVCLGNENVLKRLTRIIDETEYFVKKFEIPGVKKRWCEINPAILNYHCAFDILESDLELYKSIKEGNFQNVSLDYFPTEMDVVNRNKYFKELQEKNEENNLQYNKKRWFQNELLNTLQKVFENDFAEEL